jgi:hypothetical protein
MAAKDCELLWCGSNPKSGKDGWTFPRAVKRCILERTGGGSVLHLFGGMADFGVRMDIDPSTEPHVIGDAWLPPFQRDVFDTVIMDPPYIGGFASMSDQKTRCLFAAATWIARKRVVWFHTIWLESPARCRLEKGYLVRVGRSCAVRALQFFTVPSPDRKLNPVEHFERGPAIKYNRWLKQPQGLAFPPHAMEKA